MKLTVIFFSNQKCLYVARYADIKLRLLFFSSYSVYADNFLSADTLYADKPSHKRIHVMVFLMLGAILATVTVLILAN